MVAEQVEHVPPFKRYEKWGGTGSAWVVALLLLVQVVGLQAGGRWQAQPSLTAGMVWQHRQQQQQCSSMEIGSPTILQAAVAWKCRPGKSCAGSLPQVWQAAASPSTVTSKEEGRRWWLQKMVSPTVEWGVKEME